MGLVRDSVGWLLVLLSLEFVDPYIFSQDMMSQLQSSSGVQPPCQNDKDYYFTYLCFKLPVYFAKDEKQWKE